MPSGAAAWASARADSTSEDEGNASVHRKGKSSIKDGSCLGACFGARRRRKDNVKEPNKSQRRQGQPSPACSVSATQQATEEGLSQLLNLLANEAPVLLTLLDPDGTVVCANDLSKEYYGFSYGVGQPETEEVLQLLFCHDVLEEPGLVSQVTAQVLGGTPLMATIKVPATLHDAMAVLTHGLGWAGITAQRSAPSANSAAHTAHAAGATDPHATSSRASSSLTSHRGRITLPSSMTHVNLHDRDAGTTTHSSTPAVTEQVPTVGGGTDVGALWRQHSGVVTRLSSKAGSHSSRPDTEAGHLQPHPSVQSRAQSQTRSGAGTELGDTEGPVASSSTGREPGSGQQGGGGGVSGSGSGGGLMPLVIKDREPAHVPSSRPPRPSMPSPLSNAMQSSGSFLGSAGGRLRANPDLLLMGGPDSRTHSQHQLLNQHQQQPLRASDGGAPSQQAHSQSAGGETGEAPGRTPWLGAPRFSSNSALPRLHLGNTDPLDSDSGAGVSSSPSAAAGGLASPERHVSVTSGSFAALQSRNLQNSRVSRFSIGSAASASVGTATPFEALLAVQHQQQQQQQARDDSVLAARMSFTRRIDSMPRTAGGQGSMSQDGQGESAGQVPLPAGAAERVTPGRKLGRAVSAQTEDRPSAGRALRNVASALDGHAAGVHSSSASTPFAVGGPRGATPPPGQAIVLGVGNPSAPQIRAGPPRTSSRTSLQLGANNQVWATANSSSLGMGEEDVRTSAPAWLVRGSGGQQPQPPMSTGPFSPLVYLPHLREESDSQTGSASVSASMDRSSLGLQGLPRRVESISSIRTAALISAIQQQQSRTNMVVPPHLLAITPVSNNPATAGPGAGSGTGTAATSGSGVGGGAGSASEQPRAVTAPEDQTELASVIDARESTAAPAVSGSVTHWLHGATSVASEAQDGVAQDSIRAGSASTQPALSEQRFELGRRTQGQLLAQPSTADPPAQHQQQQAGQAEEPGVGGRPSAAGTAILAAPISAPGSGAQLALVDGGGVQGLLERVRDGPWAFHEVALKAVLNPLTQRPALVLSQRDVTERAQLENTLSELTEAQLSMMAQIFPRHVIEALGIQQADQMSADQLATLARHHSHATVMFMDLVGFTSMSKETEPATVISFINSLFSSFDKLVDQHAVHKIDSQGDCLIVGSGILAEDEEGFNAVMEDMQVQAEECAIRVFRFATDLLRITRVTRMPNDGQMVSVRIGIHTGPCVSGLIGTRMPKWTVIGDTINTAARLEQTCLPDHIQVSSQTASLLIHTEYAPQLRPTGGVYAKGKGTLDTWLWAPPPEWGASENGPVSGAGLASASAMVAPHSPLYSSLFALKPPGPIIEPVPEEPCPSGLTPTVSNAAGACDSLASASTSGIIAGGHTGSIDGGSRADRTLSERSPSLHHSIGSGSIRGGQALSHMGSARRPAYTTGGLPSSGSSSAHGGAGGSLPTAGASAPAGATGLLWAGASLPSVSAHDDPLPTPTPFSRTSHPMEDGESGTPAGTPGTAGTPARAAGSTPGVARRSSFRAPFMARHGTNRYHGSPLGSGGRSSQQHHPGHHAPGADTALNALFKVAGLTWRHTHSFAVRGGDGGDAIGSLDDVLGLRKPSSAALSPGGATQTSVSLEATTSTVLPHTASQGPGLPPTVEVLQRTQTSRRMNQPPSLQQWLKSQRKAADV